MGDNTENIVKKLIDNISSMNEVESIGISGDINPFPKAGEGDIDIFIYCRAIPERQQRHAIIDRMGDLLQDSNINVFEGGHWGVGDYGAVNGVETWLMYFTVNDAAKEVESILNGEYPDKLDNYFYPVGRLAMLKNMNVLYDKNNFLFSLKQRLLHYPEKLLKVLTQYHLNELSDTEDLDRAVIRKDVLFYHFALDTAIDHYLQALFATNKIYFPSRKRTFSFIDNFNIKPEKCNERLLELVRLGGFEEGINQSYKLLTAMIDELKSLCEEQ